MGFERLAHSILLYRYVTLKEMSYTLLKGKEIGAGGLGCDRRKSGSKPPDAKPPGRADGVHDARGGSASAARLGDMKEPNKRLVERIFQEARFIRSLGIELTGVGHGWCETKLAMSPVLQQQHGFVHAGVLMTIADHTCGGAAASTVPEDKDVITVENKVSFLRPASGTVLICRAGVLRTGRNLVFVEAEVSVELDGGRVMVAKASSTLAVIPLGGGGT
jgi:uncharacterized protein (TIGR00369 family)